jgi:LmbE family N-acetylglucosaminyl deacetylase
MNPYQVFVAEMARRYAEAKAFPLGGFPTLPRPTIEPNAPKVLIFSPHPDDECVIGALPLRLMREPRMRVINVAVTQGSRKDRQQARLAELRAASNYLGFGVVQTVANGLASVNPQTRAQNPTQWAVSVDRIAQILHEHQPKVIFFPHDADHNTTHIGTHYLLVDALAKQGPDFGCFTVETEFWSAMETPNLMLESSEQDVADLVSALTFHVGEVQRNPYHLRLPAWMIDNVRRGAELVGAQGGAAPDFLFATLYRLRQWRDGGFHDVLTAGRFVGCSDDLASLFRD